MELLIIGCLILINGIFSMSEIALVSSRKARLENSANKGSRQAKAALQLAEHPNKFLSTVQIGITMVGILTGMFGGDEMTEPLAAALAQIEWLAPAAHGIAVTVVVACITFCAIVFGELIPKRIGMTYPETIAKKMAIPMRTLSSITLPFVWLLTKTTELFIKTFNIKASSESKVTEEEIKAIIQEGKEGGEIEEIEQDIVERVFLLGDRRINTLMTPRNQVRMLNVNQTLQEVSAAVAEELHSVYPAYDDDKDNIVGIIKLKDLFSNQRNEQMLLRAIVSEANFVLENLTAYQVLEKFKQSHTHYGIIIDEYGQMQGIITLNDLLESLVGYASDFYKDDYVLQKRDDGSWLVDGHYPFPDFLHNFDLEDLVNDYEFDTVAGLIFNEMGKIPKQGDHLAWRNFDFEIIDMDGTRIDKLLVKTN